MHGFNFGLYGISPSFNTRPAFHHTDVVSAGHNKSKSDARFPLTPAVLKEKIITSVLLLSSLPVVLMVVMS